MSFVNTRFSKKQTKNHRFPSIFAEKPPLKNQKTLKDPKKHIKKHQNTPKTRQFSPIFRKKTKKKSERTWRMKKR
jgi:hypothetical protein